MQFEKTKRDGPNAGRAPSLARSIVRFIPNRPRCGTRQQGRPPAGEGVKEMHAHE
jgi:hypothetical protein